MQENTKTKGREGKGFVILHIKLYMLFLTHAKANIFLLLYNLVLIREVCP